jgi:hypothetical protein
MAEAQFEAGQEKFVLVPQAALRTAPTAPQTGIVLPLTSFDFSERQDFEDFDELYTIGLPTKVMESTKPVNGTVECALHYASVPYLLEAAIAQVVTTGIGPDYTHTQTLGDQTNTILDAVAFEHHQLKALDPAAKYNLFWGCRCNTMELNVSATGGIVLRYTFEGLAQNDPADTEVADTLTAYTDDPVDGIIQNLKIDTIQTECNITEFSLTLDHRLDADNYPLFCNGRRNTLARQNPTLSGTITMFANDLIFDYLEECLDEPNTTTHDFTYEAIESATTASFKLDVSSAKFAMQGNPINSSGGYVYSFKWRAWGSGCLVAETINQVASY